MIDEPDMNPALNTEDVRHTLQAVSRGRGFLSLMWQPAGGKGVRNEHFPVADIEKAIARVEQIDTERATGIWVRQTTIHELPPLNEHGFRKRGEDELTASIIRLFLDVDCGTHHAVSPTVLNKRNGLHLPANEEAALDFIENIGLPEPTQIDFTGGGVNPYWHLAEPAHVDGDEEARREASWLYEAWQDIAGAAAPRHGVHYGTENRDLARVLRIPGTVNRKRNPHEGKADAADSSVWPERQARTVFRDGPTYTYAELLEIARQLAPKTEPKFTTAAPGGPSTNTSSSGTKTTFNQPGSGGTWVGGVAPGLDYRNKATAESMVRLLQNSGWTWVKEDHEYHYLRHPDATNEQSATIKKDTKRLYVFTGSTIFPDNQEMNPEFVWALLNGFSSFTPDAARALKALGYGVQGERVDPFVGGNGSAADPEEAARITEAASYRSLDDIGNGERVRDLHVDTMRHIGDEDAWAVWDERRWGVDLNNAALEKAKQVAEHMLRVEVPFLRDEAGEEPEYPEDYPNIELGRDKVIPPDEWLADPLAVAEAVTYFYGTEEHREFLVQWQTWARKSTPVKALAAHAKKCRNMAPLNAMLKSAASLPGLAALRSHFDLPGSGVFVTPNTTIDTRTGETREHRQSDWNTRLCPVRFEPGAEAPLWRKFLDRNLPDGETRRYVQKAAGYAMTGDADQKTMLLFHSDMGDTGKSLLLNVLKATMGSDYAAGLAGSTLAPRKDGGDGGRDPDRHAMMGKRLLIGSEFRRNEPMDEAFMKRFTGRDPMSTRGNYSKCNTEWLPEGLIIIGTNKLFRIDLDDPAVWNRIVVVPFTVAFPKGHPERDDDLQRKIATNELEGVLAWLVEGLRMYREEGLVVPGEVMLATANYKSNSDHVAKWIQAAADDGKLRITEEKNVGSNQTQLWEQFEAWAKTERLVTDLAMGTFKKRLEELGYPYKKATSGLHHGKMIVHGLEIINMGLGASFSGNRY